MTDTSAMVGARPPRETDQARAEPTLVSVVILNYNYGRYLGQCIDSVLAQRYRPIEVIVVDDGSSDDSRSVLARYEGRVIASFKDNGGMVSSVNHGFQLSRGSVVVFLDADDYLLPDAIAAHVDALRGPGVVRSQTRLAVFDESEPAGTTIPNAAVADGDLRDVVLTRGPGSYVSAPNSGNAWSRQFLERVFPLPELLKAIGAETFLMDTAPLFGRTVTLKSAPLGVYRRHGNSMSDDNVAMTPENIRAVIAKHEARAAWLTKIATSLGHEPRTAEWKAGNWRLLTLNYLNRRLSGAAAILPLLDHLRPAFRTQGHMAKRPALALIILCIRFAPLALSVRLAGRVIKLRYM